MIVLNKMNFTAQRFFEFILVEALKKKWINEYDLESLARPLAKNQYGQYLLRLLAR